MRPKTYNAMRWLITAALVQQASTPKSLTSRNLRKRVHFHSARNEVNRLSSRHEHAKLNILRELLSQLGPQTGGLDRFAQFPGHFGAMVGCTLQELQHRGLRGKRGGERVCL